jgi:hypothetical protein
MLLQIFCTQRYSTNHGGGGRGEGTTFSLTRMTIAAVMARIVTGRAVFPGLS